MLFSNQCPGDGLQMGNPALASGADIVLIENSLSPGNVIIADTAKNAADDRSPGMLSVAAESRASPTIVTVAPSRRGVTPKAVNIRSV